MTSDKTIKRFYVICKKHYMGLPGWHKIKNEDKKWLFDSGDYHYFVLFLRGRLVIKELRKAIEPFIIPILDWITKRISNETH